MRQDNTGLQWNTPTPADRRLFSCEAVFEAGLRHHHIAYAACPIHHKTTMLAYRLARSDVEPTTLSAR